MIFSDAIHAIFTQLLKYDQHQHARFMLVQQCLAYKIRRGVGTGRDRCTEHGSLLSDREVKTVLNIDVVRMQNDDMFLDGTK